MRPRQLRILVVHNSYKHKGGEDAVVEEEIRLLLSRGHEVEIYSRSNDETDEMPSSLLALDTLWSMRTQHDLSALLSSFKPDLIHAHNTFPLISPSLYWKAARARTPVVQTLHNFRLMCLNALFLREGRVCEDCQGKLPWRGVVRGCYRGSLPASAALAGMLTLHRGLGTFQHKVARFIALSEFSRRKFVDAGLPEERVVVKPNFVDFAAPEMRARDSLLFVGRLSPEKGIDTLARAATLTPHARLRVAGEGPEAGAFANLPTVQQLGVLSGADVRREMSRAVAVVVPSICYENFPLVIAEAFACGSPVIASRIGALAAIVREGENGLLFEPGNAADLAQKMAWAIANPKSMATMGVKARAQYVAEFSADVSYRRLMEIYRDAMAESRPSAVAA